MPDPKALNQQEAPSPKATERQRIPLSPELPGLAAPWPMAGAAGGRPARASLLLCALWTATAPWRPSAGRCWLATPWLGWPPAAASGCRFAAPAPPGRRAVSGGRWRPAPAAELPRLHGRAATPGQLGEPASAGAAAAAAAAPAAVTPAAAAAVAAAAAGEPWVFNGRTTKDELRARLEACGLPTTGGDERELVLRLLDAMGAEVVRGDGSRPPERTLEGSVTTIRNHGRNLLFVNVEQDSGALVCAIFKRRYFHQELSELKQHKHKNTFNINT